MRTTILKAVRLAVLTALVLPGLTGAPADAQTTLRWRLQKGETLYYTMTQKSMIKQSASGKSFEVTMTQTFDTTWKVGDASEDSAEVTQTFDRIRMSVDAPTGKLEYDSKDGKVPEGQFGQQFGATISAIVGAGITFKINGRGEVSDVKLPDKLLETIKSVAGAGTGSPMSEEALKKLIKESTFPLPEKPVTPGTTWSKNTEVAAPPSGSMILKNTYTYKGPVTEGGKKLERIDVTTITELVPADTTQLKATIKSQDAKGSFLFDNAKGHIDHSTMTQKMETVFTMMNIESTQITDITATMTLGKPAN
ncbi:MAG TPA: DUF6263 family protein [Isosphaeraceae bacterium]|nr:DUF6263 family protein [Isosphaeraceae bacterium]